jgi:Helix-turn-helix domain
VLASLTKREERWFIFRALCRPTSSLSTLKRHEDSLHKGKKIYLGSSLTEKVSKMAKSINFSTREMIINLHSQGVSMRQISFQEKISYDAVRRLVSRYKTEGDQGLIPKYSQCGPKRSEESECSYRLVRLYKHYHPEWGVSYILMKIRNTYPQLLLCVSRVYERRLKLANKLTIVKNPPLQYVYHVERSREPHDAWQGDAKELLQTLDGQVACYLSIIDEKTGCLLEAKVFSLQLYESSTPRTSTPIFTRAISKMGSSQSL